MPIALRGQKWASGSHGPEIKQLIYYFMMNGSKKKSRNKQKISNQEEHSQTPFIRPVSC